MQIVPGVSFPYGKVRPRTVGYDKARRRAPMRVVYTVVISGGSLGRIGLNDGRTVPGSTPITMVDIRHSHVIDALDSLINVNSDGKCMNIPTVRSQSRQASWAELVVHDRSEIANQVSERCGTQ